MITIFPIAYLLERTKVTSVGNNDIQCLRLYKKDTLWCFDHPDMDIRQEPFVDGMDVILDRMHELDAGDAETPLLMFSETPFTGCTELNWIRGEDRGGDPWNLYEVPRLKLEGWLCPVLLAFFPEPPLFLFARLANWPDIKAPAFTLPRSSAYGSSEQSSSGFPERSPDLQAS